MATKPYTKQTSGTKSRVSARVVYWIVVAVLLVFLLVMYIHSRNRKEDYMKLQYEAAGSEQLYELEPRIEEETTTSRP